MRRRQMGARPKGSQGRLHRKPLGGILASLFLIGQILIGQTLIGQIRELPTQTRSCVSTRRHTYNPTMMPQIDRRAFLRTAAVGGLGLPVLLNACSTPSSPGSGGDDDPAGPEARFALRIPQSIPPVGGTILAAPALIDIGGGLQAPLWALNGQVPSPLLRVQQGGRIQLTLQNGIPQDLILHWHGLTPPDDMDGHPRLAVPPGGRYAYDFAVPDRAGTYWYHSHTHHRTGEQTYRGIGGLLLVRTKRSRGWDSRQESGNSP
jgi:hypothetical protein